MNNRIDNGMMDSIINLVFKTMFCNYWVVIYFRIGAQLPPLSIFELFFKSRFFAKLPNLLIDFVMYN